MSRLSVRAACCIIIATVVACNCKEVSAILLTWEGTQGAMTDQIKAGFLIPSFTALAPNTRYEFEYGSQYSRQIEIFGTCWWPIETFVYVPLSLNGDLSFDTDTNAELIPGTLMHHTGFRDYVEYWDPTQWHFHDLFFDTDSIHHIGSFWGGCEFYAPNAHAVFYESEGSWAVEPNPVPEATTLLLLGSGLIALAAGFRKKFKK